MKISKIFYCLILLVISLSNVLAEIELIESHKVPMEKSKYAKLTSVANKQFWVAVHLLGEQPSFQLTNFLGDQSPHRVLVDVPHTPIFLPIGQQNGVIATANWNAEWNAIRLSEQPSSAKKHAELKSMLLVTETTSVGAKFAVAGISKDNMPVLIILGENLEIEHELILRSETKGQVSSVFAIAGKLYAVVSFLDRSYELWALAPNLSLVKKVKLSGAAATAIGLKNGDIAVTYSSGQDVFDVYVEKFDSNFNSLWKRKISTRTGVQTVRYVLCELPDGLGLVGGNNGHLLVARIDASGNHIRVTEDTRSGLHSPATEIYSVGVLHNKIHVRGMVVNSDGSDGSSTSFHFVESAVP